MGGGAIWYLAVYGFAADITSVEERASRMARFDGFEQTAYVVGNALSPILFYYLGYEGAFGWELYLAERREENLQHFRVKIFLSSLSLLIILRVVRPVRPSQSLPGQPSQGQQGSLVARLVARLADLLLGMWRTLVKTRPGWTRSCILLQILAYTLYYVAFGGGRLWYLYVRKTHGWDQNKFIAARVVRKSLGITCLLVLVPILKRFNISDINLLIAFNALHGLGFLVGGLSTFSVGFLLAGETTIM